MSSNNTNKNSSSGGGGQSGNSSGGASKSTGQIMKDGGGGSSTNFLHMYGEKPTPDGWDEGRAIAEAMQKHDAQQGDGNAGKK
ncbi:hypothetical protein EJ08DRAFT_644912 [Tothia fuscella]|uniref:Uncharacterized protein n=1 Tax=Tothia fuscella TaxID=1048955 RepID=A0A9P4U381_9PEZI|nr:hypothetical protein EJ08DRAFT_644912 [Tothia fuscella]